MAAPLFLYSAADKEFDNEYGVLVAAQTRGYLPRNAARLHGCERCGAALPAMGQRI